MKFKLLTKLRLGNFDCGMAQKKIAATGRAFGYDRGENNSNSHTHTGIPVMQVGEMNDLKLVLYHNVESDTYNSPNIPKIIKYHLRI